VLAFDELYVNLAYSSFVRRAPLVQSLHLCERVFLLAPRLDAEGKVD